MKNRSYIILFFLGLTLSMTWAQQAPQVLLNPNIKYGKLDNGMTYYIMHHEEPKDRASFYIAHNVGAVLEDADQNGLAHMLEHLAFNGSANFKGKGIKNFLERQGIEFGKSINAYTSFDETVYNISNVPTGKSDVLDSCVLILHDWSGSLTMTGEEIDAERGVIKEEWRTRNSPDRRMNLKLAPTVFYNSQYAVRDVIGDMEVIEKSPYSAIRSYYKKWYRPDLQAAIIVGDFDVNEMEKRVKRILSKIQKPVNPAPRKEYPVADNKGFLYDYATDDEAQFVRYTMMYKKPATPREQKDQTYLREDLKMQLYNAVISERLAAIQQKPEAPFIGANVGYYGITRTMEAYYLTAIKPAHTDMLPSMKAFLIENERVRRHGITATELERAKINVAKRYEEAFKNRNEVSSDQYAMGFKEHFMTNEPKLGPEIELQFSKMLLPTIKAEEISQMVQNWITNDNRIITITGPNKSDIRYPEKVQITQLLEEIKNAQVDAFVDNVVTAPLIEKEPMAGKVLSTKSLDGLKAKEYTLSNGAKVVLYPTDKNENEILFEAYSPGGQSLLKSDDLPSAGVATNIAGMSGIGQHSLEDLRKILVGKQVGLNAKINQNSESLSGSSTPEDIETLMQLIYLTFEAPRFDEESYRTLTSQMRLQMENASKNLQKVFFDSVSIANAGGNVARRPLQNLEMIDQIDFEKVQHIYKDRFSHAGDFTFVFVGAIDEKTILPLVEKYIGAIDDDKRKEQWKDDGVRPYGDGYEKVFTQVMEVPKQTNFIRYQGRGKYTREKQLVLTIAKNILSQRYFATIREQEGGSYGVNVFEGFETIPYERYGMGMYFDCDPDKADKLVNIIHQEMKNLISNGPSTEDYQKAVEGMQKGREQSLEQNKTYLLGIINTCRGGVNTALASEYEDILNEMNKARFSKVFKDIMSNSSTLSVIRKPIEN